MRNPSSSCTRVTHHGTQCWLHCLAVIARGPMVSHGYPSLGSKILPWGLMKSPKAQTLGPTWVTLGRLLALSWRQLMIGSWFLHQLSHENPRSGPT